MSSPTLPTPTGAPACARGEARARPVPAGPGEELAGGSRPGRWRRTQRSARSAPRPDPLRAAPPPIQLGKEEHPRARLGPGRVYFFFCFKQSAFRRSFPPGMFAETPAGGTLC